MKFEPAYFDMRGACEFAVQSRRTLDYAKDRGDLPYIRKGRKIIFRRDDLVQWMDQDLIDAADAVERMGGVR